MQRLQVGVSVKIANIQQTVKCVVVCFTVLMTFMLSWQIHQAACFKNVSELLQFEMYMEIYFNRYFSVQYFTMHLK